MKLRSPSGADYPEDASLLTQRILEEHRAGIEQPGDPLHADGRRFADGGILRIGPANPLLDAVELGEESPDFPFQGFSPAAALFQLLIGLGAQAMAKGSRRSTSPQRGRRSRGAARSGIQGVEEAARPGLLADLEGRAVIAAAGIGVVPIHQKVDQERVGAALCRQERGSQVRAHEAGPHVFHPGHGRFGVSARLGEAREIVPRLP